MHVEFSTEVGKIWLTQLDIYVYMSAPCRFTTHLIVPGSQRRTPITAAYLCALLSGLRVLSWDWVAASGLLAGCREGDFEITVNLVQTLQL